MAYRRQNMAMAASKIARHGDVTAYQHQRQRSIGSRSVAISNISSGIDMARQRNGSGVSIAAWQ